MSAVKLLAVIIVIIIASGGIILFFNPFSAFLPDCGEDEECFLALLQECSNGKVNVQGFAYGIKTYLEIRGKQGNECLIYYRIGTQGNESQIDEWDKTVFNKLKGKDMVCAIKTSDMQGNESVSYVFEQALLNMNKCSGLLKEALEELITY